MHALIPVLGACVLIACFDGQKKPTPNPNQVSKRSDLQETLNACDALLGDSDGLKTRVDPLRGFRDPSVVLAC